MAYLYIKKHLCGLDQAKGAKAIQEQYGGTAWADSLRKHVDARLEEHYPAAQYPTQGGCLPPEMVQLLGDKLEALRSKVSGFEEKQSTMPDAAQADLNDVFDSVRPVLVLDQSDVGNVVNPEVHFEHALGQIATLDIQLSNQFEDQFNSRYLPLAFPWALNYNCGGPEYPHLFGKNPLDVSDVDELADLVIAGVRARWRRLGDAPVMLPGTYSQHLATRSEAHLGADWMAVPAARSLHWRYQVLRQAFFICKEKVAPGEDLSVNLQALIDAATSVFHRLHRGSVTVHGKRIPINGDVAMLFKADDLTSTEKTLLRSYLNVTLSIAGCQAIRRRIGHCLFGFRVVYGDVIFVTVSPNRRHSTWLLRVSRIRRNDTMHLASGSHVAKREAHAGSRSPALYLPEGTELDTIMENLFSEYTDMDADEKRKHQDIVEHAAVDLSIPSLKERQAWNAQGMLASVHYYLTHMRVLVPLCFGIRMCFQCPHCNIDRYDGIAKKLSPHRLYSEHACQTFFGTNGKLMGGYARLGQALCFANEQQGDGTPHGHGFVALCNAYQHATLEDIVRLIEENRTRAEQEEQVQRMLRFHSHLHREEHFYDDTHQANLDELEKGSQTNFADTSDHVLLGARVADMACGAAAYSLWEVAEGGSDYNVGDVYAEVARYKRTFQKEVQFIFSRVQHHWHNRAEDGTRVPPKYCRMKGWRPGAKCKMDSPRMIPCKKNGIFDKDAIRHRVVCLGVAKQLDLRCSGRRNALGSIAGPRRCAWFSATSALLAKVTKSNTNVQCNYRMPLLEGSHDRDCNSGKCLGPNMRRRLFILAQRAMKQMTGYFGGYISKKQKIGQFELKQSAAAMPFLQDKLATRKFGAASQLALICNRLFVNLEGKGILRTGVEEFMLAAEYAPHDELAAEFIRTFQQTFFFGKAYLDRVDQLMRGETIQIDKCIPKKGETAEIVDPVSLYGLRPMDVSCFYLSPWEFVQWWRPIRLAKPSDEYRFTCWKDGHDVERAEPGVDYEVDTSYCVHPYILVFPNRACGGSKYKRFRSNWILLRRIHPVVPCPENTPLPGKKMKLEDRSKIFSVYLRPWTLVPDEADMHVPLLTDLKMTREQWMAADTCHGTCDEIEKHGLGGSEEGMPTFRSAWRDYQSRIPPTSLPQIQNFMLAVVAEGRNPARNDTAVDGASRGKPVLCKLTPEGIDEAMQGGTAELEAGFDVTRFTKVMRRSLDTATKVSQETTCVSAEGNERGGIGYPAFRYCLKKSDHAKEERAARNPTEQSASVEMYRQHWQDAYESWRNMITAATVRPNEKQWQFLNLVHQRCVYEYTEEVTHRINATCRSQHQEPLFRMVHGLPGAGKSELLKWVKSYFETVWHWEIGIHFQFLAPLNMMAHGIGGQTLHSFGGIRFQNAEGSTVNPGASHLGADNVSIMVVKCKDLRFVFIDEFEAMGVRLASDLEIAILNGVPTKRSYRYHSAEGWLKEKGHLPRGFGGVNVFLIGDLYQLSPVGNVAFMSNPQSEAVMSNASIAYMMSRIWSTYDDAATESLQIW